jgi:preprotein translocase subunit SecF
MYTSKDYSRFTSTMLKLELKDRKIVGRSQATTKVLMIAMLEADDATKVEPVIEESVPEQSCIEFEEIVSVVDNQVHDELFTESVPAGDEIAPESLGCDVVILVIVVIIRLMWKHALRPILAVLVNVMVKLWKNSPWEMYNGRLQVRCG